MGEISDALRRARAAQEKGAPARETPDRRARSHEDSARPLSPPRPPHGPPEDPGLPDHGPPIALGRDREKNWAARAVVVDDAGPLAESCRHLALRVRSELERRSVRSIVITSPLRNEGKTTLACDLALAMASLSRGRGVALLDFDLRRPSIAGYFRIPAQHGVEDYLMGSAELADVRVSIDKPALDVYPALNAQAAAHELLIQARCGEFVEELERHYATVIFDTPPALLVPDANLILNHAGAYAAVARAGITRRRAYQRMLRMLPSHRLLGGILNEGSSPGYKKKYAYYG